MIKGDSNEGAGARYIGVRKRKWGRWVTEIREPGKKTRIWLGSFDTPEMAAVAYDVAAWYLKGSDARINFPELVESFPKPASADADDVRQAAQQAAMQLRGGVQLGDVGSGDCTIPARVKLSPSDIQAINEAPLDSPKMWMELAGTSGVGEPVRVVAMELLTQLLKSWKLASMHCMSPWWQASKELAFKYGTQLFSEKVKYFGSHH